MNPQLFGPLMDRLSEAGALDVFYAAVQMKKNRPGTLVTVIAPPGDARSRSPPCCSRTRRPSGSGIRRCCATRSIARSSRSRRRVGPMRFKVATPRRPRAQCRAGVRRLRAHRLRTRHAHQGCAGHRHARLARFARRDTRTKNVANRWRLSGLRRIARYEEPRTKNQERRMTRFYLTTAIDYVNSRPHLGTAYEKIAADVIARYKRLCGVETHFVMGNDEHSQNVFRKARELGEDPLAYCDRMAQEFLDVWKRAGHFVRRLHPHDRAAPPGRRPGARPPDERGGRHLRRALRRLVLRVVRGLQAGEGPRRRRVPDSSDEAGLDSREESLLPALEVRRPAAPAFRGASGVPRARRPAQRDPPAD